MNVKLKKLILIPMNLVYKINPKLELSLMFWIRNGYKMDWKNPTTFNQKLQWIKLYDKNKLFPICSDKYEVRKFIKDCGCKEILNDLFWEGFDANEIPFDELPNQFVIKVTHGSGFNIICRDKKALDREKTIKQLNKWLREKFIPCYGEWFYGIVKPRIIVEKFLTEDNFTAAYDYKVMCYNGEPKYIMVHRDRFTNRRINFYDLDWKPLESGFKRVNKGELVERPNKLEEILEYSKTLSKYFYHARVDFYIVDNKIYFGEITFINGAGFDKFLPYSFDMQMGNWMKLPDEESALDEQHT